MHTPNTTLSTVYRLIERLEFSDRDVVLMASTLAHQTGYLYGHCLSMLLGATAVWMDVWQAEAAARLVAAEGVTFSMGATPFLRDLTYVPGASTLRSLRLFISAGAPIPRPLVKDARAQLGCAISAGWGMTENGLVTCNGLVDPEDKVFGTDGLPLPGMELRVVDDDGRDLPRRDRGRPPRPRPRPVRRLLRAARLHRRGAHARRLVPHGGPRHPRRRRLRGHHRAIQGPDHPRRREHPGGRGREPPLRAPEDRGGGHRGHARPAAGRARVRGGDPPRGPVDHAGRASPRSSRSISSRASSSPSGSRSSTSSR